MLHGTDTGPVHCMLCMFTFLAGTYYYYKQIKCCSL